VLKKRIAWAEPDIGEEEADAVSEVIKAGWIGGNGKQVKAFEMALCSITGAKYALALANGTLALTCAMQALREKKIMMKFLIPTLTFFATASTTAELQRSPPYLMDSDKISWNMKTDTSAYRDVILVPVDLCGVPCEYDTLKKAGKIIIADSAESLGSKYKGNPVGTQAKMHCFSFHSTKVVTAGEGGVITTNDKELYELAKSISNQGYGQKEWYEYRHERLGFNYRMSEIHATIALVQLKKLQRYLKERKEKAQTYRDILSDLVGYQETPKNCTTNNFLFPIIVENNVSLSLELINKGIGTKCIWTPIHQQKPFLRKALFPNADYIAKRGLFLPIHNRIDEEDVKEIASIVKEIVKG
jgi:perosamine synthetase